MWNPKLILPNLNFSWSRLNCILLFEDPDKCPVKWPFLRVGTLSATKKPLKIPWVEYVDIKTSTYMYLSSLICRRNFRSSDSAFTLTTSARCLFCWDIFIWLWKSSFWIITPQAGLSPWSSGVIPMDTIPNFSLFSPSEWSSFFL